MDDPDLTEMSIEELLDRQHQMTEARNAALAESRRVQAEIDRRAEEIEERRRADAAMLGQVERPPTQYAMGGPNDG